MIEIKLFTARDVICTSTDEDLGGDSDGNDTMPYTWVKP